MTGQRGDDDDRDAPSEDLTSSSAATDSDTSTYAVGYGKPPVSGRIKPGEVRNPRGKAKGVRSFRNEMDAVLKMPVSMMRGGKTVNVTTMRASLLKLREKALKGDIRSLERLLQLAAAHATDDAVGSTRQLLAEDAQILAATRARDAAALAANATAAGPPATERTGDEPGEDNT